MKNIKFKEQNYKLKKKKLTWQTKIKILKLKESK